MTKTADVAQGAVVQASWGNEIRDRTAQVFATVAERDSQWASAPTGALCITLDTNTLWQRVSGAWLNRGNSKAQTAVVKRASSQSIPNNVWTAVTFDGAVDFQNTAFLTASAAGITVVNGPCLVLVTATVSYAPGAGDSRFARVTNSSGAYTWLTASCFPCGGGNGTNVNLQGQFTVNAGELLKLWAYHNIGAALNIQGNDGQEVTRLGVTVLGMTS